MTLERVGRNVVVGGAPDRLAAPDNDDLGGLMAHAGSCRDLLREGSLGANVHQVHGQARMRPEKGFDLFQGRDADGSGRAVLEHDREVGRESGPDLFFARDALHRGRSARVAPECAG